MSDFVQTLRTNIAASMPRANQAAPSPPLMLNRWCSLPCLLQGMKYHFPHLVVLEQYRRRMEHSGNNSMNQVLILSSGDSILTVAAPRFRQTPATILLIRELNTKIVALAVRDISSPLTISKAKLHPGVDPHDFSKGWEPGFSERAQFDLVVSAGVVCRLDQIDGRSHRQRTPCSTDTLLGRAEIHCETWLPLKRPWPHGSGRFLQVFSASLSAVSESVS